MHNNIMAAGSRDRPPMLATGRYAQWRSRFLQYIDTRPKGEPNGSAFLKLKKCGKPSKGYNKVNHSIFKMSRQTYFGSLVNSPLTMEKQLRSHATTRYKGKEIAKPITPPSESASEEDKPLQTTTNNLENSQTPETRVWNYSNVQNDNQDWTVGNQRAVNVVGARETVGGPVVQQSGIQCFNCKEFGHYAKECRKSKRVKDSTYHKEKLLLVNQLKSGVRLQSRAIYLTGLAERMKTLMNKSWKHITVTMQKIQECFKSNIRHETLSHWNSSSLVLHQMTSDHNRSELGIHDHSNEQSSSKLVPKVFFLKANKTATSRKELELLFHHQIAMLRTTGINPMIQPEPEDLPKDNPKLEIAVLRLSCNVNSEAWQIYNTSVLEDPPLSWKPVKEISLNLPDHSLEWEGLSCTNWVRARYGNVNDITKERILQKIWDNKLGGQTREKTLTEEQEDPEKCGETKTRAIIGAMINKLPEEWFSGVSRDMDDLEGIIDYLEPRLYDGFIDHNDDAYKQRRNKLLGLPYTEPPLIIKEEAEITKYNLGAGEVFTKTKILNIKGFPRTTPNIADIRAKIINDRNGKFRRLFPIQKERL
ncbi:retrovirus-related pol polyprotein from transposon TNT 1-94 [Tanacetum coccineum]